MSEDAASVRREERASWLGRRRARIVGESTSVALGGTVLCGVVMAVGMAADPGGGSGQGLFFLAAGIVAIVQCVLVGLAWAMLGLVSRPRPSIGTQRSLQLVGSVVVACGVMIGLLAALGLGSALALGLVPLVVPLAIGAVALVVAESTGRRRAHVDGDRDDRRGARDD